jgi:hypothetical protein
MPLPPLKRTATGRSMAALGCWVAMAYRANMRPVKVPDDPGSVQSGPVPDRVRIRFSGASGGPGRA